MLSKVGHANVVFGRVIQAGVTKVNSAFTQPFLVSRADRERLNGHPGRVIWFTGLSGSGKSTLANALEVALHAKRIRTYILDGDNLRQGLNKDLGFTIADRAENMRRIAEVAQLMMNAGITVLVASIAPFSRERELARNQIWAAHFFDVYVNTPIEICEQRDPKGLYKSARGKAISDMTGMGSPYEAPNAPRYIARNHETPVEQTVRELMDILN